MFISGVFMRVAHFITPAGFYGAEQWVFTFLKYFDQGEGVLVCTDKDDQTLINKAKDAGIEVFILRINGSYSIKETIDKLSCFLSDSKVDILHTHGYKSDIIGYFSAKKSRVKVISTPHGWDLQSGFKVRMYDVLDRFILRFFDRVVPLSIDLEKTLDHISNDRVKLINNLVDLDGLPSIKVGDINSISYIGRLTELKCVNDIIMALSLLPDRVTLQIIGDGPKKQELINLCAHLNLTSRVTFYGFREDRLDLLNNSGLLVLASLSEGTSRTLMEAMAMQRLVIGSDIPGNRILIDNDKTGYLFKLNDYKHLSSVIDSVIQNKTRSQEVAINGRRYIYDSFSAKKVVDLYYALYLDVLSDH